MKGEIVAVVTPSIGPAVITLFGHDIPVLAMSLSCVGLLLARYIAPPPKRDLSQKQRIALTFLLLLVLFLLVTGAFTPEPMQVGSAVMWGIGLGFSGLLAIEYFGNRVLAALNIFFTGGPDQKGPK